MNITISASDVAWYGAIVATLSVSMSAYALWRDRPKLTINVQKDQIKIGPGCDNTKYTTINVANAGRRPVTLGYAEFLLRSGGALILGDSGTRLANHELSEGKSCVYLAEQDKINLGDVRQFVVFDGTERAWRRKVRL